MPFAARTWAKVSGVGVALALLGVALIPLDEAVGRALVGARGLVLASGGLAFLGGADFLAPVIGLVVVVLLFTKRFWGAARVGIVMLAADLSVRGLKVLFARPRPEWALVDAGGYAFPSGHAASGAALAVLFAWFAARHLRARLLVAGALLSAVAWAALMALGRLVLGVHHLSDVVAGVGWGVALAGALLSASIAVERWALTRRDTALASSARAPPLEAQRP